MTAAEKPLPIPVLTRKGKGGRPARAALDTIKKPGIVGRPPGHAARLEEFRARLLGTTGDRVIDMLITKAMDRKDKDQIVALRILADRIIPASAFEADAMRAKGIHISISTTGGPVAVNVGDTPDPRANDVQEDSQVMDGVFREVADE